MLTPTGRAIWFSLPAETRARMESRVLYMCNYVRLIHLDILYDNTWSIYIYNNIIYTTVYITILLYIYIFCEQD